MRAAPVAKEGVAGLLGALGALGVTPDDIPLFMAILIGLVGGTAAAWARERQSGNLAGWKWLGIQVAAWLMIFMLVNALYEWPGVSIRWAGALAALGAFASREGLQAIHRRTLREIEEREI